MSEHNAASLAKALEYAPIVSGEAATHEDILGTDLDTIPCNSIAVQNNPLKQKYNTAIRWFLEYANIKPIDQTSSLTLTIERKIEKVNGTNTRSPAAQLSFVFDNAWAGHSEKEITENILKTVDWAGDEKPKINVKTAFRNSAAFYRASKEEKNLKTIEIPLKTELEKKLCTQIITILDQKAQELRKIDNLVLEIAEKVMSRLSEKNAQELLGNHSAEFLETRNMTLDTLNASMAMLIINQFKGSFDFSDVTSDLLEYMGIALLDDLDGNMDLAQVKINELIKSEISYFVADRLRQHHKNNPLNLKSHPPSQGVVADTTLRHLTP